jgi:hypothetical protein
MCLIWNLSRHFIKKSQERKCLIWTEEKKKKSRSLRNHVLIMKNLFHPS